MNANDDPYADAVENMRVQATAYLERLFPGAKITAGARMIPSTNGAYALNLEAWADEYHSLRISDTACVVMKPVTNIGDEFDRIGVDAALRSSPHIAIVLAAESTTPMLRLGDVKNP